MENNRKIFGKVVSTLEPGRQAYIVAERKPGFLVKIKKGENFNHRNTGSISKIII